MEREDEFKNLRDDLRKLNVNESNNDNNDKSNNNPISKAYEFLSMDKQGKVNASKRSQDNERVVNDQDDNNGMNMDVSQQLNGRKRRNISSQSDFGNPLTCLTKNLLDVYKHCHPGSFRYTKAFQTPRRVLTKDPIPGGNDNYDNKQGDLIITVGDILSNSFTGQKFKVLEMLGQGTFGQVVKCRVLSSATTSTTQDKRIIHQDIDNQTKTLETETKYDTTLSNASITNTEGLQQQQQQLILQQQQQQQQRNVQLPSMVAIKIVKNRPAYSSQAKVEVKILEKLVRASERSAPAERHLHDRIVHILDSFQFHSHMCMVFELMSINLFEYIKQNGYRGFTIREISSFTSQILAAMKVLSDLKIVHCDLKPENILIENFSNPPRLKLVDFGSACFEGQTVYTYIQSRFYRAPEVIIGLPYCGAIDIWSLGCIIAELWMGLPVFPGISNHNQLLRIEEILGDLPEWMHEQGKQTKKFYKQQVVQVIEQQPDPLLNFNSAIGSAPAPFQPPMLSSIVQNQIPSEHINSPKNQPSNHSYSLRNRGGNPNTAMEEVKSPQHSNLGHGNSNSSNTTNSPVKTKTKWILKTPEEYASDENLPIAERMDRFCKFRNLEELIFRCDQKRRPIGESPYELDKNVLKSLLHLLSGLLSLDPTKRFTVADAIMHPFVSSPTMTAAQSPVRRPSTFFPSSPLVQSPSPHNGFSSSPFSIPTRPLAPHPFANDWVAASAVSPYNPLFMDDSSRAQLLYSSSVNLRSRAESEYTTAEAMHYSDRAINPNFAIGHSNSASGFPLHPSNPNDPLQLLANMQQQQRQQQFHHQQILQQHLLHHQQLQQQKQAQSMQQQIHLHNIQRTQSLQQFPPAASASPHNSSPIPQQHPQSLQALDSIRRTSSGSFDIRYQNQPNFAMRSPATSELGPQSFPFTSISSPTNVGPYPYPSFATGVPASAQGINMAQLPNNKLIAPMPSVPFFTTASSNGFYQTNSNVSSRTPRSSGLRLAMKTSSSVGEEYGEQVTSPLTLGSYASSGVTTINSDAGFQTGQPSTIGNIIESTQGASPSYAGNRLVAGIHPRFSFGEQTIQSSPTVRRGSNLCYQSFGDNGMTMDGHSALENRQQQRLRASSLSKTAISSSSSPSRLQVRRLSAFSQFAAISTSSSKVVSRTTSPATAAAIASPSFTKVQRTSSLTSSSSGDQGSIGDFSVSSNGMNETMQHQYNHYHEGSTTIS